MKLLPVNYDTIAILVKSEIDDEFNHLSLPRGGENLRIRSWTNRECCRSSYSVGPFIHEYYFYDVTLFNDTYIVGQMVKMKWKTSHNWSTGNSTLDDIAILFTTNVFGSVSAREAFNSAFNIHSLVEWIIYMLEHIFIHRWIFTRSTRIVVYPENRMHAWPALSRRTQVVSDTTYSRFLCHLYSFQIHFGCALTVLVECSMHIAHMYSDKHSPIQFRLFECVGAVAIVNYSLWSACRTRW